MNRGRAPVRSALPGALSLALAFAAVVPGCADARDTRARFDRDVAPVLERRCAGSLCHGEAPGFSSPRRFHFATDAHQRLASPALQQAARVATVEFINTNEAPGLSSLLRKALPAALGGGPHGGGALFRDTNDPAYRALWDWIAAEQRGGEDGAPEALTEGERFFAREVQPGLRDAQCMLAPCHGHGAGFPLRFDPGAETVFGARATRANYQAALVHLALGGFSEQSRLLRKVLREPGASIAHRGGNGAASFPATTSEPIARAITAWADLERSTRAPGAPSRAIAGVVFVGGPPRAARITEHDRYFPGTDLYLLAPARRDGTTRNLTRALHAGPVEIRNPTVDDAGARVAFSMRRGADEGASLWELDLATGASRARTLPARRPDGAPAHDLWPAYGPDGRLWFVSTRPGVLAEHADGFDTDLFVVEADGAITRKSFTPSPELFTTFLRTGNETAGSVTFTAIRQLGEQYRGVVYRFPEDLHSEYHQHFGITLADDVTAHLRELPDGNSVAVLLDRDAVWSAGALVLIDRNQGPALSTAERAQPSLPGFIDPVSFLGPYGSHDDRGNVRREVSDGAYRDPSPLPDGRVLVSYTPEPLALRDPGAAPDFALYALTLTRDRADGPARIASRDLLADLPAIAETEPVAVYRAVAPRTFGRAPEGAFGTLVHGGAPVLEQLLTQVGPSRERPMRADLGGVRVLEWVPQRRDPRAESPSPALHPEQRRSGATPHAPARILAEIPLEADGSFTLELAAGTAFRLQFLDAQGAATGTQHNRWFDMHGGQTLRQGISSRGYDAACAHCHGARSGAPSDTFAALDIDAVSSASRTLARFEEQDPQRPRAPPRAEPSSARSYSWLSAAREPLRRSCAHAGCHDARSRAAGLSLEPARTPEYDAAYEALVARGEGSTGGFRYVAVASSSARESLLWEVLHGREFDAPGRPLARGAHTGEPPLSDDERAALLRWIESGSLYCIDDCP